MSIQADSPAPATGAPVGPDQLHAFLHQMVLMRRFEEKCGEMYTRGKIRGFLHLYTGQEACATGVFAAFSAGVSNITSDDVSMSRCFEPVGSVWSPRCS